MLPSDTGCSNLGSFFVGCRLKLALVQINNCIELPNLRQCKHSRHYSGTALVLTRPTPGAECWIDLFDGGNF